MPLPILLLSAALAADGPQTTITVDPLTTALGYVHLQVERVVGDSGQLSVYAGPHARLFDGVLTETPEPFLGAGAEVGIRWFPKAEAPEGLWVMGRTVGAHLWTTDERELSEFGGYASVLVGSTWVLGEVFVLSGGLGFNYLYYDIDGMGASGPFPAAHSNLGVAF